MDVVDAAHRLIRSYITSGIFLEPWCPDTMCLRISSTSVWSDYDSESVRKLAAIEFFVLVACPENSLVDPNVFSIMYPANRDSF
jgi:hypothetical protein